MLTREQLGIKLKRARKQSGRTQQDTADQLGISRQKLIQIEKGTSPLDTILLKRMADTYGVTLDYFFQEEEDTKIQFAFRSEDLGTEDQIVINWARKVLLNIKNLEEINGATRS